VIVINNNESYYPYYDSLKNEFTIFGRNHETYQLKKNSDKDTLKGIVVSNSLIKESKNIYKYSLEGNSSQSRWFSEIIEPKRNYTSHVRVSRVPIDMDLFFYLYSFNKESDSLQIVLNGIEYKKKIKFGNNKLSFKMKDSKIINYSINTRSMKIGIKKIEYHFKTDKVTYSNDYFAYNISDSLKVKLKSDFKYYTLKNNKLYKVSPDSVYFDKNLFVQSKRKFFSNNNFSKIELKKINKLQLDRFIKKEYLIVTVEKFKPILNHLIKTIQEVYGLKDVDYIFAQDIYNTFSYSTKKAESIQKFLHKTRPADVLLLGDTNVLEKSNKNLIPTFFFIQKYKNTRIPTDYKYCYKGGEVDNPLFTIRRLPFRNIDEVDNYLANIKIYNKNLNNEYIIIDDENYLKKKRFKDREYFSIDKSIPFKEYGFLFSKGIDLINPSIIHYLGHGSLTGWSSNKKINIDVFRNLENSSPFIMIDQSCWTAEYSHLNEDSFHEKVMKLKGKGSIFTIAASGLLFVSQKKNPFAESLLNGVISLNSIANKINKIKINLYKQNKITYEDLHNLNMFGI